MNIPTSLFFFCYFFFFFWLIYLFQFADASPSDKNKSLLTNTNRAISRLLLQTLPTIGKDILKFILGNSAYESLRRGCHYVLYERNPLLQLLYIGIINGAYAFWLLLGQPLLPTLFVPNYHKSVILAGIVFCQYLFYLACTTAPGQITQDTEEEYDRRYPYDGTVFVKGLSCETCAVRKVARSKHCRLCDKCVPRFDHHCIWLNQCIGANNHKYFLSFLLFHAIFLSYCSYVSSAVLLSEVVEKRLFQATFLNKRTNKINKATHWVVLKYLIYHHYGIIIIFGLVFVMAIAMIFFLGYHLHLVRKGTTTNETGKWEDAKLAYHELKHRYEQYTRGAKSDEEVKHVLVHDMMGSETASAAEAKDLETVQMTPCGAFLRGYSWKERVIAEDDDSETTSAKESRNYYPDPGDEPQNIYNRGFFANMSDIIWPLVISDTGTKKNPKASKKNK